MNESKNFPLTAKIFAWDQQKGFGYKRSKLTYQITFWMVMSKRSTDPLYAKRG